MNQQIRDAVQRAIRGLINLHGNLFDCPIEGDAGYDARKLHEVCINHQLANLLEQEILNAIPTNGPLFVDIEFNREGVNFKNLTIDGIDKTVRPDIIVHNRKSGHEKLNLLVVECKKEGEADADLAIDDAKIRAFMAAENYEYRFGLRVIYGTGRVRATFYFKQGDQISSEELTQAQFSPDVDP